ncbi:hypothetical protein [Actinoplanes sp. NPDC023714]|uniref:hypothetical protein n=1 Tax=Actinoplanes sp. NPDC023714 TaxID=3154322 RepID=UPI0033E068D9
MISSRIKLAGALLAVLTAAGCGSTKTPAAGPSTPISDPPAVQGPTMTGRQVDPPLRFDPAGLPLGTDDVLLHGALAFAGTWEGVAVTRLTDGSRAGLLKPSDGPPDEGDPGYHRPVLAGARVVTPYVVDDGGVLVVADAATGASLGTVEIDLPPVTDPSMSRLALVGAKGDVAVVLSGIPTGADPDTVETVAVNLATGKTLWTMPGLEAHAVLGTTIVGLTGADLTSVTGVRVTDGEPLWEKRSPLPPGIDPAGPKFAVVDGLETDDMRSVVAVVDAAGKFTELAIGADISVDTCHDDQQGVAACTGSRAGFGLDTSTGKLLWQLPAGGEPYPYLTAAWHGTVYGQADGKPFTLDARTGEDKGAEAGMAPAAVNAYGGVVENSFHPAIG